MGYQSNLPAVCDGSDRISLRRVLLAPTYQPETLKAYTLGSKNRFLDNRLHANIEAFY